MALVVGGGDRSPRILISPVHAEPFSSNLTTQDVDMNQHQNASYAQSQLRHAVPTCDQKIRTEWPCPFTVPISRASVQVRSGSGAVARLTVTKVRLRWPSTRSRHSASGHEGPMMASIQCE